jgi:asparagine synthase (glutamine-hydrolysing)
MCGICGIIYRDPRRQPDIDVLRRMTDSLRHRGPDDEGRQVWGQVGFGHRRLAILDLSPAGHQPFANEDGSVWIVFNGEIYNFPELRTRLKPRHTFRSNTDTEVLVHLYEELGEQMVSELDGMFAFALYDARRQRVVFGRDPFGIKPLYYAIDGERLVFGSEIKALLASGEVSRTIDASALNDYFDFLWIPAPRSIYAEVHKLPPANWMTLDLKTWHLEQRRYWELEYLPQHGRSLDQWADEVQGELNRSVRAQLISDVPLGAFLSGGIDSTLVSQAAAAAGDAPLHTFTIEFADKAFSESKFAAQVAEKIHANAVVRAVASETIDDLPELIRYFDEPFADSSMLPTFAVSRVTREYATVALSGDGGDELFTGYSHHCLAQRISKLDVLPDWLNVLSFRWATHVFPSTMRLHQWGRRLSMKPEYRRLTTARLPGRLHRLSVLRPDLREDRDARLWHLHESLPRLRDLPPVTQVQMYDLMFYLPNDMLVKVDRASMAHSLEVRVPFLSKGVAELAFRIPEEIRFQAGQDKRVLRRLVARHFGETLAQRPKMGFSIPLRSWMELTARRDRARILQSPVMRSGLLDESGVAQLLSDVGSGYSALHVDRSEELFALLVLSAWWERFGN